MGTIVHVPVDGQLSDAAAETLDRMGLSPSDAVRILFTRIVAEREFPLELKVPNSETASAMREAEALASAQNQRFRGAEALLGSLDGQGE